MSPDLVKKNEGFFARTAARREVRRLRQNKKKVPAELLAQAGVGAMVTEEVARKRKVAVTVQAKTGPVVVQIGRQQAAKELGIKNRRWLNAVELDEAINLATDVGAGKEDGSGLKMKTARLDQLQALGRDRCKAAWDAWKAKQQ